MTSFRLKLRLDLIPLLKTRESLWDPTFTKRVRQKLLKNYATIFFSIWFSSFTGYVRLITELTNHFSSQVRVISDAMLLYDDLIIIICEVSRKFDIIWFDFKSFENDLYLNYKQGGAICLNVTGASRAESDWFLFWQRIMKLAAALLASVRACSVGPDNLCIANNDAAKTTLCDKMKWYCHDGTAQESFEVKLFFFNLDGRLRNSA